MADKTREIGRVPKDVKLSNLRDAELSDGGALIMDGTDGKKYVQYGEIEHPKSHGWWPVTEDEIVIEYPRS